MTVLQDSETPEAILKIVKRLRVDFGVGKDDVYVVDAEHENLSEGSYGISAECLMDYDWMTQVYTWGIEGYWLERCTGWCIAVHPR